MGSFRTICHFRHVWILCICVILTPVCAKAAAQEKVVLQLKWKHQFQFAGYYAAQLNGYYEDAGLQVEFLEGKDVDTVEKVLSGEADFGIALSDLVLAYAEGKPVVAVATLFQHSPLILIRHENNASGSIHDMEGARVMMETHSEELRAYLVEMGIPLQGLEDLPYENPIESLMEGRVDAISGYITDEPFHLQRRGISFQMSSPRSVGIDFYGDTLFTTLKMERERPELVEKFRQASIRGWEFALKHPQLMIEYILETWPEGNSEEALRYEAEQVQKLVRSDLVEIGYMHPGRWQHIADVYADLGIMPRDVQLQRFLYNRSERIDWSRILLYVLPAGILFLSSIQYGIYQREQRKKQQKILQKLRDLEKKWSNLLRNLPGMAYRCHNDGEDWVMEYVSSGCLELTGFPPEKVIGPEGIVYGDLIHPDDARFVGKVVSTSTIKGERFRVQYRLRQKDGSYRWVWEQGMLVENGGEGGMLEGFVCDIHEQKRLEEEKEEAIQALQKLLDELKILRGIIPICSSCKKIRNDRGGWDQMEAYIRAHSEAEFSHGICPDCLKSLYPGLMDGDSE